MRDTERTSLSGRRVLAVLAAWIISSVAVGLLTATLLRATGSAWASDVDHVAVVIVAEVYLLLIVAVVVGSGGPDAARSRLRLTAPTGRYVATAVLAWAGAYVVTLVACWAA